jgi:hypothetical protein
MARDAAMKAKNQIERVESLLEREKEKDATQQKSTKR